MEKDTHKILEAHRRVMLSLWWIASISVALTIAAMIIELNKGTFILFVAVVLFWCLVGYIVTNKEDRLRNDTMFKDRPELKRFKDGR